MGRDPRIEYSGAIYHVMQRGNNKEYIFNEDIDKGYFIKQIKEMKVGMGFKIYAYALMNNHYHFVFQRLGEPLQTIMHQINNKYSKYFNYKFKHTGHVFEGRYKAILVQDERYLLSLVRYVHQNPVVAKISLGVENYKWSSDLFYRRNIKDFIDIDTVLDIISKNRSESIKIYKQYMLQNDSADYDTTKVIGEEAYQVLCKSRERVEERKRLDEILIETDINSDDYELIKSGSRKRHLTQYKLAYIKAAIGLSYTLKVIGQNIKMSDAAVIDIVNRYGV